MLDSTVVCRRALGCEWGVKTAVLNHGRWTTARVRAGRGGGQRHLRNPLWHRERTSPTPPTCPLTPFGSKIPQRTHLRPSVYMWTMCSVGRSVVMTD
jgi:hypothetical protein